MMCACVLSNSEKSLKITMVQSANILRLKRTQKSESRADIRTDCIVLAVRVFFISRFEINKLSRDHFGITTFCGS